MRRLRIEPLEQRRLLASLSGYVYNDTANNDGLKQASDAGIQGCAVTLTGTDNLNHWVSRTAMTNAQGAYSFMNLRAGFYKIKEEQPADYIDGKDTIGTAGGTVGEDQLSRIAIGTATNGLNYNFGELKPGSLSGYVWDDTADADGVMGSQEDEPGIIGSNLLLIGTDDLGQNVRLTAVTDTYGAYGFANLRPGTYSILDDVPTGYTNGQNFPGTQGGTDAPSAFQNIALHAGASGTDYDFGKLMRYDINPAVAYTLVLKQPNGDEVRVDSTSKYHLYQGDLFTIEVYATDIRRGVGASGGVASAHVKLIYDPDFMDYVPGSLKIAPEFDLAASGSMNEPMGRIEDAGGVFDLVANGSEMPGAGVPQLLFSVEGQVPATVANTSLAILRLAPADNIDLKTMVFGMDGPVFGSFQTMTFQVGSFWRNSLNPWDANRDGVVDALDELAVIGDLAAHGPRQLPETVPPGAPLVDVSGDGVLNYLDALLIHQRLSLLARSSPKSAANFALPSLDSVTRLPTPRGSQRLADSTLQDADFLAAIMAMGQSKRHTATDSVFANAGGNGSEWKASIPMGTI